MSETLDDLARRLVAHPRWKWRAGMAVATGDDLRLVIVGFDGVTGEIVTSEYPDTMGHRWVWPMHAKDAGWRPDLTDPATGGVLLDMLTGDMESGWHDMMCLSHDDGHWTICDYADDGPEYSADTLGEAAARALLEVWGE